MQPVRPGAFLSTTSILIILGVAALLAAGGWWIRVEVMRGSHASFNKKNELGFAERNHASTAADSGMIDFPEESWRAAKIEMQPLQRGTFSQSVQLTGKIALNEDRVAHVFPLVEGRVEEVKIRYGDKVKKGELLVVVQSKEVGQTMLQLFQDRLQRDFAITKDHWTQVATSNTLEMIKLILNGAQFEEIEKQLRDRPMGDYREKLMSAYVSHYKARKQLDRVGPLSQDGAVAGKQLLEVQSEWEGARATLRSLVEQIQQDAKQASTISSQSVKELQTRVSVDETNLKILGFSDELLKGIDPAKQGETISFYPVTSPFDGTIISKDVVLLERVGPDHQILSIADLSTVWVTTDIYEEHMPLLSQLANETITLHSNSWPGKTFQANVFYCGDVVNESSRTIAMRAIADNKDGFLKPGMFIDVELPSLTLLEVLQVPLTAIQEHEGKSFVFVHISGNKFDRRDVTLGRRNTQAVEIQSGLKLGEAVVVNGGFALKSRMLADLLNE